jgi:acyl transferase domain-containing protein/phosphopantetheinyl transferase
MGCLFPGAPDLQRYWTNLRDGVDAISDVPAARLDPVFFDRAAPAPDRFYCRRGGFVDALANFDPTAFGVMPRSVPAAEPDQFIALSVAAAALEDAGYGTRSFARERTAVILGRGGYPGAGRTRLDARVRGTEQTLAVLRAVVPSLDDATLALVKRELQAQFGGDLADGAIGLVPNLAASRIANRLDLHGPAYTVDAACASALVALDHACRELESGSSDLALTGGMYIGHDEAFWSVFTQLGALSHSEQIRPFDRRADGLLIGEGVGIVVLKRLADAERDGDRIYAVVRGTGLASDGREGTLMSPAVGGQRLALEAAWTKAGLDPASVAFVEAHGTGTPAGDAAELETLASFFGRAERDADRAVLGSVKSMIGHTMPAAGAAGLIKAALGLYHGALLPTLHCDEPHDALRDTRFRTIASVESLASGDAALAGVNAFGFGGINAHAVLQAHGAPAGRKIWSASDAPVSAPVAESEPVESAAFSAPTTAALLADLAAGRQRLDGGPVRLVVVGPLAERADRARALVERGKPWRGREDIWFSPYGLLEEGRLAFVYPGVDAEFVPRVDDLADALGVPRPSVADPSEIEELGRGVFHVNRIVDRTLRAHGLVPSDTAGHSLGEWNGMMASGIVNEADFEALIRRLGKGWLQVPGVVFAAAGCGVERAREAIAGIDDVELSHDNCPHQVLLCGVEASVDTALERLRECGVICQKLPFRSGFHSSFFVPYLATHRTLWENMRVGAARETMWSATIAAPFPSEPSAIRSLALRHLVETVRFRETIEAMYESGVRVFVQAGAGSLTSFIEDTLRGRSVVAIPANVKQRSGAEQIRRVLAAAFIEGASVDPRPARAARGGRSTAAPLQLGVPLARNFTAVVFPEVAPNSMRAAAPSSAPGATSLPALEGLDVAPPLAAEFVMGLDAVAAAQREVLAYLSRSVVDAPRRATSIRSSAPVNGRSATPANGRFAAPANPRSPSPERVSGASSAPAPSAFGIGSPPFERRLTRTISLALMPELADHALIHQPPGWPAADTRPTVPMTATIELIAECAVEAVPGSVAIAVEGMRAFKWIFADPPLELHIRATYDGDSRVAVAIEGYAEATVVIARSYPSPPAPDLAPFGAWRAIEPDEARDVYAKRYMFHGPRYHGIVALDELGSDGVRGRLVARPARGQLLDNGGQLFGYWMMRRYDDDRVVLPIGVERIAFYGPHPEPGTEIGCSTRIRYVDDKTLIVDVDFVRGGALWARASGWTVRRFGYDERLFAVTRWPEHRGLSAIERPGFAIFDDTYTTAITREQIAWRYLSRAEERVYAAQGPRTQRAWLNGRIALKDAVRDVLRREGASAVYPIEIESYNLDSGAPAVRLADGSVLNVSLAHKREIAVALADRAGPVGIDVETIEARSANFVATAFAEEELALVEGLERDEWLTRLWVAKEAAAKRRGTGLGGDPRRWQATQRDGERFYLDGGWVRTARRGDVALGWTER